jgi:hypothetical protein
MRKGEYKRAGWEGDQCRLLTARDCLDLLPGSRPRVGLAPEGRAARIPRSAPACKRPGQTRKPRRSWRLARLK